MGSALQSLAHVVVSKAGDGLRGFLKQNGKPSQQKSSLIDSVF